MNSNKFPLCTVNVHCTLYNVQKVGIESRFEYFKIVPQNWLVAC